MIRRATSVAILFCLADPSQAQESIVFASGAVERAVRQSLGGTREPLTIELVESLDSLKVVLGDVTDLSGLQHLRSLEWLHLGHNDIRDLSPLADLRRLRELLLNSNEIQDLGPLSGLTELRKLQLSTNRLADVTPLAGLVQLEELSLYCNEVDDLQFLTDLKRLKDLTLSDNRIASAAPLAELPLLEYLAIDGNQVADLSPLAGLDHLTALNASRNRITDVGPIGGLTALRHLSLRDNDIRDLAPLSALGNLRWLDVSGNGVQDVSSLASLRSLASLSLRNNRLSDVSIVAGLGALTGTLDLTGNEITHLAPLLANPNIGSVEQIFLSGNPLTAVAIEQQIPELLARGVGWIEFDGLDGPAGHEPSLPGALPALPLIAGNFWIYDHVAQLRPPGEQPSDVVRTPRTHRMEVFAPLTLRVVSEATWYIGGQRPAAYGDGGRSYHRLYLSGSMGMFADGRVRPDTLYARTAEDGSILVGAYASADRLEVLPQEELWIRTGGEAAWTVPFARAEFFLRLVWIGIDPEFGGDRWRSLSESGFDGLATSPPPRVSELARRLVPGLTPASPNKVVHLIGTGPSSHSTMDLVFLTGVGLMRSFLSYFEFNHQHLELAEASVAGRTYVGTRPASAVRATTWGNLKREVRVRGE